MVGDCQTVGRLGRSATDAAARAVLRVTKALNLDDDRHACELEPDFRSRGTPGGNR